VGSKRLREVTALDGGERLAVPGYIDLYVQRLAAHHYAQGSVCPLRRRLQGIGVCGRNLVMGSEVIDCDTPLCEGLVLTRADGSMVTTFFATRD